MSWIQLIIVVLISMIVFAILSSTKLGVIINTSIFTIILAGILIGAKLVGEKEKFFFEVSPYKKCGQKGFYGRPLTFDYQLPDCSK